MTHIRVLVSRVLDLLFARRRERRLDEEIRDHLDLLTEQYAAAGLTADDARAAARREFGGVDRIKEAYRDQRGLPLLDALGQDFRFAVRQLTHAPGLTVFAMLALAVGVGGTMTVFTLVNGVLLRPLPFERPGELYRITRTSFNGVDRWISVPELTRWQRESRAGGDLVGFTPMDFNLPAPTPKDSPSSGRRDAFCKFSDSPCRSVVTSRTRTPTPGRSASR